MCPGVKCFQLGVGQMDNLIPRFLLYRLPTANRFRLENTDHVIDVNKGNGLFEYDQVNIICPVYNPGTHEEDAEKYIIYNVSKEEYDTCRITNQNPRIIAVCDKPYREMYFTITFRSFTPQPNGLEFHPGQDYYFISTSSQDDLHRRIGGRCLTNNMRVIFKVCCRPDEFHNQSTLSDSSSANPVKSTVAPTWVPQTRSPSPRPTTNTVVVHPIYPPVKPTALDFPKPTTKKSHEYDKSPNEVVKNEELTFNTSASPRLSVFCISFILACLVLR
ncbi:uncharacterized protein Ephrin isoform X2 [Bemisia tabaci]|uniref:uncharacterized protein Ephrin isoform X2 n=1 Tax=Bemisia tabaci TaxID=7038 RepID=UPI003B280BC2